MEKLNLEYKTAVAKDITELVITNKLLALSSDEVESAKIICRFYQTVFSMLDADIEEQSN